MKRICSLAAALLLTGAGAAWAAGASSSASDKSAPPAAAAGASSMTEAEVVQRIEAQGYTQVSDVDLVDGKYEARAQKGGQSVEVRFDPATGQVSERQGKGRTPG